MKKLLSFAVLGVALICGSSLQAQPGNISGHVMDSTNNQPVRGGAVFIYNITQNGFPDSSLAGYIDYTYTDPSQGSNGYFDFGDQLNLPGVNWFDSLMIGAVDCNYNLHTAFAYVDTGTYSLNIQVPCAPFDCQALLDVEVDSTGNYAIFKSLLLRDEASYTAIPPTQHLWEFSDNVNKSHGALLSPNHDTVMRELSSFPSDLEYCYTRFQGCNVSPCDSTNLGTGQTGGNNLTCNAHYYVDTVNSVNHQGQVVMWENSTTSSGSIIDYHWDFGDGTTYNNQYPTHTYNDTDIYNVCLTITSVDGGDTCTDTFCDSIGFDSNGNLVYKTTAEGFTINVIDPSTVGIENAEAHEAEFNLFPNPSRDRATLTWNRDFNVHHIEVITMNGQTVRALKPRSNRAEFTDLNAGIYILRITGENGVTPVKMIVK